MQRISKFECQDLNVKGRIVNGEPWLLSNDLNDKFDFLDLEPESFVSVFDLLSVAAELAHSLCAIDDPNDPYQQGFDLISFVESIAFHQNLQPCSRKGS